jgi:hypothetical protein
MKSGTKGQHSPFRRKMKRVSSDDSITSNDPGGSPGSFFQRVLQVIQKAIASLLLFIHDLKCLKSHRDKKNLNFKLELR